MLSLLVGRDRELDSLDLLLEEASAGRGGLRVLCGAPGIGKTRLADELSARAAARSFTVAWGRAWETGGAPAYWPSIELLAPLAEACSDVPPRVAALLDRSHATESVEGTRADPVGPYQKRKGFDIIAHAASGIMSNYADEDGSPKGPGAINYIDICTGMFNALGIVSALYHRQQTGQGQKIETSLFSTGLSLQAQNLVHIDELDRRQHERELEVLRTARGAGKKHTEVVDEFAEMRLREDMPKTTRPIEVPDCKHRPTDRQVYPYYRVYPTGDGYLSIAALNRNLREKLCSVLEISDPHTDVDLGNISDEIYFEQKALMHTIEQRLQQQPNDYWLERLEAAGVPCGQVNYRANLYDDPQVRALDMMWELQNQELGAYKAPGHPVRFSKTPVKAGKGTPTLGQDSDALLVEMGYSESEISRLKTAGVVK